MSDIKKTKTKKKKVPKMTAKSKKADKEATKSKKGSKAKAKTKPKSKPSASKLKHNVEEKAEESAKEEIGEQNEYGKKDEKNVQEEESPSESDCDDDDDSDEETDGKQGNIIEFVVTGKTKEYLKEFIKVSKEFDKEDLYLLASREGLKIYCDDATHVWMVDMFIGKNKFNVWKYKTSDDITILCVPVKDIRALDYFDGSHIRMCFEFGDTVKWEVTNKVDEDNGNGLTMGKSSFETPLYDKVSNLVNFPYERYENYITINRGVLAKMLSNFHENDPDCLYVNLSKDDVFILKSEQNNLSITCPDSIISVDRNEDDGRNGIEESFAVVPKYFRDFFKAVSAPYASIRYSAIENAPLCGYVYYGEDDVDNEDKIFASIFVSQKSFDD
jgi:hypothetical protein